MSLRPVNCVSLSNGTEDVDFIEHDGTVTDRPVMSSDMRYQIGDRELQIPKRRPSPTRTVIDIGMHSIWAVSKRETGQQSRLMPYLPYRPYGREVFLYLVSFGFSR
jgi:hypothetical protein